MPHYYPVVFPAGRSLAGDSLGFHAYSLRVDNCTNQWYLEESTVSYIPPYSLGMCLRLYGTGVAILLAQAPIGQPQLTPIAGEQVVGVYSDQLRTEVAASPIRQFTLVQAVSDLTEGPEPALPPVGVDRLWADTAGNIHHIHSDGTDLTLVDPSNASLLLLPVLLLGGDLSGQINNALIVAGAVTAAKMAFGAAAANVGALSGALTGTLPAPSLGPNAVGSTSQIAPGVIDHTKIANGEVWNQNLAGSSVDNTKIAAGTILQGNMANNSIGSAQIIDASITRADLAANATVRRIGNYSAVLTYSTSSGGWVETTLNTTATVSDTGQTTEVFLTCCISTSVAGGFYATIGVDSSPSGAYYHIDTPTANARVLVNLHAVIPSLGAGVHRFGLFVQQAVAETITIDNSGYSTIDIVEWNN